MRPEPFWVVMGLLFLLVAFSGSEVRCQAHVASDAGSPAHDEKGESHGG